MSAGDYYDETLRNYLGAAASSQHNHIWKSTTYQQDDAYKEIFGKLITYMLGSNLPQATKDEFVNAGMRLKEFRDYVGEYFPQYADKIKLWEKLHGPQS